MNILFLGGNSYNLTPNTLTERGTTGWVLYLIKLTEGLAKLGHKVYQINRFDELIDGKKFHTKVHNGVNWIEQRDHETIKKITQEVDIAINLIGWDWLYTDLLPDKCKKILWLHNNLQYNILELWNKRNYASNEKYGRYGDNKKTRPYFIDIFDKIMTSTMIHKAATIHNLKLSKEKVVYVYPGVNHFEVPKVERNQFKLIYYTNATQGLQYMPYIYEKLKKLDSRYSLTVVSNSSLYGFEEDQNHKKIKNAIAKFKDVNILTELTRDELMKEVASSKVYLFPCSCKETFGFGVLEAIRCGTFVVTSNIGSFKEFEVESLVKINVNNEFQDYKLNYALLNTDQLDEFVKETHNICKNNLQSGKGVEEFTWEKNALGWDKIINGLFK